jgi:hypothetical protein
MKYRQLALVTTILCGLCAPVSAQTTLPQPAAAPLKGNVCEANKVAPPLPMNDAPLAPVAALTPLPAESTFTQGEHEVHGGSATGRSFARLQAYDGARVRIYENCIAKAYDTSSVEAYGAASVYAYANSKIKAGGDAHIVATNTAELEVGDSTVTEANGNVTIVARGNATVYTRGNCKVKAYDHASIVAQDNTIVEAYGNSSVIAQNQTQVNAHDQASVTASGENVQVTADGGATVYNFSEAGLRNLGNQLAVKGKKTN